MLIAVFSNYFILLSIFGFSLLFKKILFKKEKIVLNNIDFLYGLVFLIFISLLINFFFPLNFFTLWIILLGILIFLYGFYKNNFKINLIF